MRLASNVMSDNLTTIKAEIKHWEHTFKDTHGHEPTREDIKADPVIGMYPFGQVSDSVSSH